MTDDQLIAGRNLKRKSDQLDMDLGSLEGLYTNDLLGSMYEDPHALALLAKFTKDFKALLIRRKMQVEEEFDRL